MSAGGQRPKCAIPGEGAQRHDDADLRERRQLADQVGQAGVALLGRRSIVGRGAAVHGGHVQVAKPEPVRGRDGGRLRGQTGPMQRREQHVAGAVAGEDTSGAVATVGGRGQADQQDPSRGVAHARHGTLPVGLAPVPTGRIEGGGFTPGHQPRAARADDHFREDHGQRPARRCRAARGPLRRRFGWPHPRPAPAHHARG